MRLQLIIFVAQVVAGDPAVQVLSGEPLCPTCRVERYRVATLQEGQFHGTVGLFTMPLRTRSGHFLVTRDGAPSPFVADSSGRVVKLIGRRGQGPGEFMQPFSPVETGDGYVVLDVALRRATHLTHEFEVTRTTPIEPRLTGISMTPLVLPDDRIVLNLNLPTRSSAGEPLHLLSVDGKLVRSFGSSGEPFVVTESARLKRVLALGRNTSIWAGYNVNRYRLERWDTAGRLIQVFERHAPWFPTARAGSADRWLVQIEEDSLGRLWTQLVLQEPRLMTVVEILDVTSGRIVASAEFEGLIGDPVAGGFYVQSYAETPTGEPRIEIWAFRLSNPTAADGG